MSLQLGQIAPDFTQQSTTGEIRFHEWLGDSWGLFPIGRFPECKYSVLRPIQ